MIACKNTCNGFQTLYGGIFQGYSFQRIRRGLRPNQANYLEQPRAYHIVSKFVGAIRAPKKTCEAPLKKFQQHVQEIAHAHAPASITAYTYNCKAVPVLSYVAQLIPLPHEALKVERHALFSITHMATNAFTFLDFFGFAQLGAPEFRCIAAHAHAALTRCAICNVPH